MGACVATGVGMEDGAVRAAAGRSALTRGVGARAGSGTTLSSSSSPITIISGCRERELEVLAGPKDLGRLPGGAVGRPRIVGSGMSENECRGAAGGGALAVGGITTGRGICATA